MCGIFGLVETNPQKQIDKIKHRGPDNTRRLYHKNQIYTFHRLCINDLSYAANQPFEDDNCIWMCNGEIYNYKSLISNHNIKCKSNSDCEVISQLYETLGICSMCNELDGVFAISLYDKKFNCLYLIRDPIGVRPIYYYHDENTFTYASEGKQIQFVKDNSKILQLPSSSFLCYDMNNNTLDIQNYFNFNNIKIDNSIKLSSCASKINNMLTNSIQKRLLSDRPIGCLLSGGLDSSLVASILTRLLKGSGKRLKTFSVGFKDSEDLKYAKVVSEYLETDHYELILDYDDAIKSIPSVINSIETYDTTTVRASVGMYLLSRYISENHEEKVIFSGEGSDEIFGGYLYFHKSPTEREFEMETLRLVNELQYFDVLRADRCTAAFGLELRVPFLDKEFVNYVLSIPGYLRKFTSVEKKILRIAFDQDYLPLSILYRKKEGFSDGVGGMNKPFYKHIQEYIVGDSCSEFEGNKREREWYMDEYKRKYNYKPIDHYWMPKWTKTHNPSGRIFMSN